MRLPVLPPTFSPASSIQTVAPNSSISRLRRKATSRTLRERLSILISSIKRFLTRSSLIDFCMLIKVVFRTGRPNGRPYSSFPALRPLAFWEFPFGGQTQRSAPTTPCSALLAPCSSLKAPCSYLLALCPAIRNSVLPAPSSLRFAVPAPAILWLGRVFNQNGNSLSAPNAGAADPVTGASPVELQRQCQNNPCPGGAQRMAKCDRAAVNVDALPIQLQFLFHRKVLRRERFIDFE